MRLEPKQVLLSQRFNPFKSRKQKEWWYTGIVDRANDIFTGFSVIRVMFIDAISFALFDPARGKPLLFHWKGYLDKANPPDVLSLKAKGRNFDFSYTGSEEQGWSFSMHSPVFDADFSIKPVLPRFTKFDNYFVDDYMLLHYFHNSVQGSLEVKGEQAGSYRQSGALGYMDHCAGEVPSRTKWHWIALQSEHCALASLMNYGVYPQCYTQAYFTAQAPDGAKGRWIRLDQDVSFECYHQNRFEQHWRISSPDLYLKLEIIQTACENERIPPLVPFLVNLDHYQCSVRSLEGYIRVDGTWLETGELRGVMEEHYGKW